MANKHVKVVSMAAHIYNHSPPEVEAETVQGYIMRPSHKTEI
jgi:F0F1-type ATP synthase epsilon subunit